MNFLLSKLQKGAWALNAAILLLAVDPVQGQPTATAKDVPEPAPIPADHFIKLHTLIKPQSGELRFHEIPWLIDVWEARKKAAAEGKPILVWSGAGGAPLGTC